MQKVFDLNEEVFHQNVNFILYLILRLLKFFFLI